MTTTGVHSNNLREFYFSTPPDVAVLDTLELRHPAFDEPVRVVNDDDPFVATLEDDAVVNGGEEVTFRRGGFEFTPPESSGQGMPSCDLVIDNAARLLQPYIRQAKTTRAPVEVTYRQYRDDEPDAPGWTLEGLTIAKTVSGLTQVTASVAFEDVLNKSFPARLCTKREFTGLDR